jgi:hypothetical protein
MPSTAKPYLDTPVPSLRRNQVLLGAALAIFLLAGLVFWWNTRGPSVQYETQALRPLLKHDAKEFHDPQVGLRFTPPTSWSMQGRTTEAPDVDVDERMLVKFKRLIPGRPAAWLRVYVEDAAKGESVSAAVKKRQPGPGWSRPTAVQSMTVNGQPAAKITYSGVYNNVPSVRDVIGVQRGQEMFWFVSTYQVADFAAREQTLEAVNSVIFQR